MSLTPGQEFIETSNLVVGNAAENVGEPGLRIDAAEHCRFDQRNRRGKKLDRGWTGQRDQKCLSRSSKPPDCCSAITDASDTFQATGEKVIQHMAPGRRGLVDPSIWFVENPRPRFSPVLKGSF